jgi:Toprim-like
MARRTSARGIQAHDHIRKILLVEGAPDYLAACQLIAAQDENILPVTMLGASASISHEAIKYFTCRNVTIVAHPDNAGREAAMRWGTQLQDWGAIVQAIQLKKGDLCSVVASGETYEHLVRS